MATYGASEMARSATERAAVGVHGRSSLLTDSNVSHKTLASESLGYVLVLLTTKYKLTEFKKVQV